MYQIVSKFTTKMLPSADAIILISYILVNLQPPILKVDKGGSDDTSNTSIKRSIFEKGNTFLKQK